MNLESPQILSDLYRDLRDRRLLPLIGVLLAGIVIVPIVLSKSPEAPPPAPATAAVTAKQSSSAVPAEQVVLSTPGLRDYKRRLKHDGPTDPFIPVGGVTSGSPSAGVPGANNSLASTGQTDVLTAEGREAQAAQNAADSGGATIPSSGGGTATSTLGSGSGTSTRSGQQVDESKFFYYRVKVRSGQVDKELQVHDSVGSFASLPSKAAPALTFLGVTTDKSLQAKAAVFLVSPLVSSVSGEGDCTLAGGACQTLYLKPGEHEDIVWTDGLTYRLELVKFNLVTRNRLPQGGNDKSGKNRQSRHH